MKANDLFKDLWFKKNIQSDTFLIYSFETDYDKLYVDFDLVLKIYYLISERFIDRLDRNDIDFIPMEERPQNIKHSSHYGHWQSDNCIFIDMKLHNAIHQQLLELGWIKGDVGE